LAFSRSNAVRSCGGNTSFLSRRRFPANRFRAMRLSHLLEQGKNNHDLQPPSFTVLGPNPSAMRLYDVLHDTQAESGPSCSSSSSFVHTIEPLENAPQIARRSAWSFVS